MTADNAEGIDKATQEDIGLSEVLILNRAEVSGAI
jgi:hypothetical protein